MSHASQNDTEQLFLVFLNADSAEDEAYEQELAGLVEAAGGEICGTARQRVDRPQKRAYVGKGKVEEIALAAAECAADAVVFDAELSGIQIRNLEEDLKRRVIDRTSLILDIFANRAKTKEGQLQVELALYSYMLPRLMSVYTKFERQRGGIGMRGPGETKLEADRRMVRQRIAKLQSHIDEVQKRRSVQRASRGRDSLPTLALVGYTSAGKSTLMNSLTDAQVLADAMPFATLDPTTRKVEREEGQDFYLIDTVGFIRGLPTQLVAAFRATLEETLHADILIHVLDVSSPEWEMQRDVVIQTVEDLGASDVPMITAFNKIDALEDPTEARKLVAEWPDSVAISALKGEGIADLMAMADRHLEGRTQHVSLVIPFDQAALVDQSYKDGTVHRADYEEDGIHLEADLSPDMAGRLAKVALDG